MISSVNCLVGTFKTEILTSMKTIVTLHCFLPSFEYKHSKCIYILKEGPIDYFKITKGTGNILTPIHRVLSLLILITN